MVRLTIQCGMDSTTFPIYINGTWIRNISLSFIPEFYKYEIPDEAQSAWFTTEIKTHLTNGWQVLNHSKYFYSKYFHHKYFQNISRASQCPATIPTCLPGSLPWGALWWLLTSRPMSASCRSDQSENIFNF